MDCFCEMDNRCTSTETTAVSASLILLEEKYRRSVAFGEYLEQHPDCEKPLIVELIRGLTMYRIALSNAIKDIHANG